MRFSCPHVESGQAVLLFVLACCSAAAQPACEPPFDAPHIYSITETAPVAG